MRYFFYIITLLVALDAAGEFTIYTIDGEKLTATKLSFDESKDKELLYYGTEARQLKISRVNFVENNSASIAPSGDFQVSLTDGSILNCSSFVYDRGTVTVTNQILGVIELKDTLLSRVIVRKNFREEFLGQLADQNEDIVIKSNGDVSKGILNSADKNEIRFNSSSLGDVVYKISEIAAVSLVQHNKDNNRLGLWKIVFSDQSRLLGSISAITDKTLTIRVIKDLALSVSLENVVSFSYENPNFRYLSDIEPVEAVVKPHSIEGLPELKREYQKDLSARKTILSIAGKRFSKGLGVRAQTILKYKLGREYKLFHSAIGIDDCVDLSARKYADVRFYVYGDDKELFKSGIKKYGDAPEEIKVNVSSVNILELRADFGDVPEVGDWADWASARVTK
ncbi:MAG: NPCBM/NEW2 domain-containing protein [Planctomycetes bacterium]|nr:NPCBM/NEW2 domain-containing protein [Planctomycetota bacterium]